MNKWDFCVRFGRAAGIKRTHLLWIKAMTEKLQQQSVKGGTPESRLTDS